MAALNRFLNGRDRNLFKNMLTLLVGTGTSKLLALLVVPLLTRLYSPEDFGLMSVYISTVALLATLVTGRYVMAIPLPKTDFLAASAVTLCLILTVICTALILAVTFVVIPLMYNFSPISALSPYWWLVALGVLGASYYEILSLWATRKKTFKAIAAAEISQSVAGALTKLGLAFVSISLPGLVTGQAASKFFGCITMTSLFYRNFIHYWRFISLSRVVLILKRYSDLPFFRLPSQFLMVFSVQAPIFFMASIYGSVTTGQLGLAISMLAVPIQLLGTTTSRAYFGEISTMGKNNGKDIKNLTVSVVKKLLLLSIFPTFALLFGGSYIFKVIFGEQWGQAGVFASYLSIYLVFQFLTAPLVSIFTVYEKQKVFLIINILRVFLVCSVFFSAKYFGLDAETLILIYSFGMAAFYILIIWFVFREIEGNVNNV